MPWEAWITVGIVLVVLVGLVGNVAGPEIILIGGLTLLMTLGAVIDSELLLSPAEAVAGFGNEGLITIGVLFVITAGLTQTGAMSLIVQPLLGRPRSLTSAQARMMFPVVGLSAFLNNTPVVGMFMPVVNDWVRKYDLSASRLFIPLSYAAMLGGTCTLIGTSTNLVVYGMLDDAMRERIGMFTITAIGVPVAAVGVLYILLFSRKLLPERKTPRKFVEDPRHYTVEMMVADNSPVAGRTIEQAGLRNLPGVYLMEIERGGERMIAVPPTQQLIAGDRLIFVGVVESVVDLQRIRGLVPATNQVYKLTDPRPNRILVEAVVSPSCPLVGKSIRSGQFRTIYGGVVIAVHRNGQQLTDKKIGDIVLQPGDTLLIETHPRFIQQQRDRRDFFLVSGIEDSRPIRYERAWVALSILALMVTVVAAGWLSMLNAAMIAAGLMILTRACTGTEARRSIDWRVLLVIGAALGIGHAMVRSEAAMHIADYLVGLASGNPWLVLVMVYLVTALFTEVITNTAAAVLVVPIASAAAVELGVDVMPFVMVIMLGASASFATPIGYQTNLMVYGPGGYKFTDYLRIGLPLNVLVMAVTVVLAPLIWPFE